MRETVGSSWQRPLYSEPALSPAQLGTTSARVVAAAASMVGISIGCVLGLAPLRALVPPLTASAYKGSTGKVGIVGGCLQPSPRDRECGCARRFCRREAAT